MRNNWMRQKRSRRMGTAISADQNYFENKIKLSMEEIDNANSPKQRKFLLDELANYEIRLNDICEYRTAGAMLYSKSKWYEEGEWSSKYFYGLEKVNYTNKSIKSLINSDNEIIRDQKKILLEQVKYYQKFTANLLAKFTYENHGGNKLSQED